MLDNVTKKRIDDLRNILVGKIPSPQSQVEQITTGLIYKFMYDMDQEAIEMGGIPSFFVGEYEKYSWKNLFDPKISGAKKVQLYSDAIEHMYSNPTAPHLFREIFKNSFLPFKDPSTLNMFLKEINEFHYSHSEKLGDAFEYLLSFMGSQGDAGQFRTPRHIIDFVVELINPQKNEGVLDPACGTAGFLISSYKHILKQNTGKKLGDKLSAVDRKKIGDNLVGYDISPDMTRISLVNMYLHQFASPQIHEYDTLSSEDRWNEYFDVILANPPFFSPTGGIQPHSRFGVQSTRAEVLFVDYIMEHLKPNGRAGIVVPEGIIFQTGNAYKSLRKKLIDDYLIGVISLPAGIFQPYSGVKTSILILDKNLSKKTDCIFFEKIENDGFSLGTQRTPTDKNDLPVFLKKFESFCNGNQTSLETISKKIILSDKDLSLNASLYKEKSNINTQYPLVKLGDLNFFEISSGGTPKSTEKSYWDGKFNWISLVDLPQSNYVTKIYSTERTITESGLQNSSAKILPVNSVVVSTRATIGRVGITKTPLATNQGFKNILIKDENRISAEYLAYMMTNLKDTMESLASGGTFKEISKKNFETLSIPLPPIEIQKKITKEIDEYQKIIDGCRQVVENYKPLIDIDTSWEMVELNKFCSIQNGYAFSSNDMQDEQIDGSLPIIKIGNVGRDGNTNLDCKYHLFTQRLEPFLLVENDLVIAMTGATVGKVSCIPNGKYLLNQRVGKLVINDNSFSRDYIKLCITSNTFYDYCQSTAAGGAQGNISSEQILRFSIPKLDLKKQNELVDYQQQIQSVVNGNKKLIEIYTQKIQDQISKIWGN